MSDILHEALQDFRSDFEPNMKAMLSQLTRTTSLIMNAYAHVLNAPTLDVAITQEDTAFLGELRHHHDLLIHSVTHELDMLQNIGAPRKVERYFNFVNGEVMEVEKKDFVGLPEDDELVGKVYAYGSIPEE